MQNDKDLVCTLFECPFCKVKLNELHLGTCDIFRGMKNDSFIRNTIVVMNGVSPRSLFSNQIRVDILFSPNMENYLGDRVFSVKYFFSDSALLDNQSSFFKHIFNNISDMFFKKIRDKLRKDIKDKFGLPDHINCKCNVE